MVHRGDGVRGWCSVAFSAGASFYYYWIMGKHVATLLAVDMDEDCLDIFSLAYHISFVSPSLWVMAQERLKYCLKVPSNPKQLRSVVQSIVSLTSSLRGQLVKFFTTL